MTAKTEGDACHHCRNGWFPGQEWGEDVECVNGVLIDIDVAHEGWQRDTVYPPAPCIAREWGRGYKPGWGDECQRRLAEWASLGADGDAEPESASESPVKSPVAGSPTGREA